MLSGAFKNKPPGHQTEPLSVFSILATWAVGVGSSRVLWQFLLAPVRAAWKGGIGSRSGLWYILGLGLLLTSGTWPLNGDLKKHLGTSVPLGPHIGLWTRKSQLPWLGNGATLQLSRRAYSEGLGCSLSKFCVAPVVLFWFKSYLNALMISLSV